MNKRVLIYDPVPFKGGSKKVMQTIISQLPSNIEVWVISNDKGSWHDCCEANVHFIELYSPRYLQNKTTGILYFLKHFVFLMSLLSNMVKLKRFSKIIGFSGPNVDFSLYLLTELINIDIIQLIQGNIANSTVASFGLVRAKQVFYLPSTRASIARVMKCHNNIDYLKAEKFTPFVNGVDCQKIQEKQRNDKVGLLWAASLLKWKRVDLFIAAMTKLNSNHNDIAKYFANICYIQPKFDAYVELANDEIANAERIDNIHCYADPSNLNEIRANSSVFISTAEDEPFGLSILESMIAGLAIVIPADDAYWDQHLIDGYDCLKYDANDTESLVKALVRLINDSALLFRIAQQARHSAQHYSPLRCYSQILKCIPN